ncbi:glycerate kinase [Raineyella antarctica]|uniref:Glycerate kinase n=1 Tax=Raineyella antarctica TaxID=1577474 RepID=A0A1G6GDM8_9ACTN|nr:glycerate kinase [Raineyella antarctica]SDB80112.1 glycerate kinase [Raineyella antarctica]
MRVVFATDRIGPVASAEAGEALATGWQRRRPQDLLAVVPLGAAGAGLLEAYAALSDSEVLMAPRGAQDHEADDVTLLLAVDGTDGLLVGVDGPTPGPAAGPVPDDGASSAAWGEAIARAVADAGPHGPGSGTGRSRTLAVDLGGCVARDAGAGLLAMLGAVADVPLLQGGAALSGATTVDLSPVRALLSGFDEVVAIVPADEADRLLLGMRGITSLYGAALREAGLPWDPADLLRADAGLERFSRLVAPGLADAPGLGACGGAAYALAALGARIVTGPQWLAERVDLASTLHSADLVVTGAGAYDFAHRGGETVEAVVAMSGAAMRPVVAVAAVVTISSREMRSHGLEAAYALSEAPPGTAVDLSVADLAAMGERLARTWTA